MLRHDHNIFKKQLSSHSCLRLSKGKYCFGQVSRTYEFSLQNVADIKKLKSAGICTVKVTHALDRTVIVGYNWEIYLLG